MLVGHRPKSCARGFTLIELITTITVMAILAGIALPSFSAFIANQRVRNVSFDLMAAITLARSQAVTRNTNVSLQKVGTAWDGGWRVSDGTLTFHNQEAYKNLSITDSTGLGAITYGKDGRAVTTGTKFTIAPSPAVSGVSSRCVSIGLSGVPSSSTGAC
ncbi:GspH/FimT family pseudopilin [Variovorax paradoxus]|uniref:GspH/FimT family pseudopilin n=1 Tax=Variovorax paradoxus TaxID=34073 RepID=UPI003ED07CD0